YVTPYEVIWRLTMIPGALLGVLFPLFAATSASDRRRSAELFSFGGRIVYVAMFPLTLLLVVFAEDLLLLWLGTDFAQNSTSVLQWLSVGVFLLSFGLVAATALQGAGLPRVTGLINLIEMPFYVLTLWWL